MTRSTHARLCAECPASCSSLDKRAKTVAATLASGPPARVVENRIPVCVSFHGRLRPLRSASSTKPYLAS